VERRYCRRLRGDRAEHRSAAAWLQLLKPDDFAVFV
jgi:hypothetical protein